MQIYNSYTKKIETITPLNPPQITMYNCGPTVYDFVHIGNLRTFLMADFLRRSLEFLGYQVKQVKNITDVGHLTQDDIDAGEDKMIKAATKEQKTPQDIALFYENAFHNDEARLNILPAHVFPKATEYIDEMIAMITTLIQKNYAYEINGSVYYEVDKFSQYGQLSGNTIDKLKIGARLEINPEKRKAYDFALWLKADENHLMKWNSPWGVGYPGWHIECSAMSTKNLGNTIDIHTGGEDNIFPHHEDEIAQSEAATGVKFANYWVHGRHLLVDGEKMSKSKGNFFTLQHITDKGFSPLAFRYLCLTSSFVSNLNFTWQSIEDSQNALNKLQDFIQKTNKTGQIIPSYTQQFTNALKDNLNTPIAMAIVWKMIKDQQQSATDKKATLLHWDKVLGLNLSQSSNQMIPNDIMQLVQQREQARQQKDFATSDLLRNKIQKQGYNLEDNENGTQVYKINNTL